ncbi:MAG: fibronectin type III domain-containing protein [bacterium]
MNIRFVAIAALLYFLYVGLYLSGCSKKSTDDDDVVDDGSAPTTITDLTVTSFSDSSVTLTWTASGDDSTTGTAASYDLRMSNSAIHWGNFDSALQVSGVPAPKPAGQTEQFEVRGLTTDSTYFFALIVADENDNYEGVSNCVSATCFNDFAVNIPDAGLLAAIRVRLNKPTGEILKSDLTAMFDLPAVDRSIADLTGLEYCTNLMMLNIINNSVSDLSPLAQLTRLDQLHAGQNAISDITPLAALTGLTWLRLNENQIVEVDSLAGLTNLTDLDLRGNLIVNIMPIAGLTDLQDLDLSSNRIKDIGPLVSNAGLGAGDDISLILNPLEHESIMTHIPALRSRGATVHWVDNIVPPGDVIDLRTGTITASSVALSWTAPGEDFYEGTAYHYELRYATDQNELETWSGGQTVAGAPDPDTAGTTQSIVVSGLLEGTTYYFALRTQDNSENWSAVSNVVWAKPYSDAVVTFSDPALEAAIRNALAKPTGGIYKSELLTLDTLIADDQGITDLSGLEYCANLILLHLVDNAVAEVDQLTGLTALYDLNLQGNSITDISPLASLDNLGILQLTGNTIGSLADLSGLDNLWFLSASFVGTGDLQSLATLTNLQYLFVIGNGISDLTPLSNCTHLKVLYAEYNSIQTLTALGGLLELENLSLKNNDIEDISPLVSNPGLATGDQVALENNPLSSEATGTQIPALRARGVTVTY